MNAKDRKLSVPAIPRTHNRNGVIHLLCSALVIVFFAQPSPAQTNSAGFLPSLQGVRSLSYAEAWGHDGAIPASAAFESWADRFTTTSDTAVKALMLGEGITLSRERHVTFAELIKSDPAQAIASSVPASVRQDLPHEIESDLEVRVSGTGDLSVLGVLPALGGPAVEPVQRFIHVNGRTYRAYVYGRRASQTTKQGIPLHGVALGDDLALHESVLRELEADEVPNTAMPTIDLRTPAEPAVAGAAPTLAEMGGKIYRFASPAQLREAEARLEAAEGGLGPQPSQAAATLVETSARPQAAATAAAAPSAWTTGNKKVLIIRVDFSDLPGDPKSNGGGTTYTASYVQNLADTQISPYYQQSSYGLTSLSNTVTTQVYRMPQTAAYYAVNGANDQLHTDAETAAAANYTLGNYDRIIVLFSWLGNISGSHITYGGLSNIGGPKVWLNGEFDFRLGAHELGHTYGLFHASLWQVSDGNPISTGGTLTEYGDDFDSMGQNFANDRRTDFNPYYKNILGWISDSQVLTVVTNGTYRIYRFDNATGTGTLALKIAKDSSRTYWVGIRREFTTNLSMQHGAYIIWAYSSVQSGSGGGSLSGLLDMTTPGNSDQDAALAIGAVFIDSAVQIGIRPVAEGGTTPQEYMDVQVTEPVLIAKSPTSLTSFIEQGRNPPSQSFAVWNSGSGSLSYTITTNASWLSVSPTTGSSSGGTNTHVASYSTADLTAGVYSATITITSTNALNSPQSIPVSLYVNSSLSGLLGWWVLGEGSGLTAYDSSGNGNTGTVVGATWTSGIFGSALHFDGTDQVTISNSLTLNPAHAITVSAWVNAEDWFNFPRILEKGQSDNQYGLLINPSGQLEFLLSGVTNGTLVTDPPSEGSWHHVAGTYDGSLISLYIDGQAVAQQSASGPLALTADALAIGNRPGGNVFYKFAGLISDVRIYGQALSAAQVAQLYRTDSIGDGIANWWRQQYFGGGSATDATSCATCDYDGTGQNNLFKYVAGLDPTDPTQVFTLQIAAAANQPGQVSLIFNPLAAGRGYMPQFSTDLVKGVWSPLTGYAGPATNLNQVTITDLGAIQTQKFYRIDITYP